MKTKKENGSRERNRGWWQKNIRCRERDQEEEADSDQRKKKSVERVGVIIV